MRNFRTLNPKTIRELVWHMQMCSEYEPTVSCQCFGFALSSLTRVSQLMLYNFMQLVFHVGPFSNHIIILAPTQKTIKIWLKSLFSGQTTFINLIIDLPKPHLDLPNPNWFGWTSWTFWTSLRGENANASVLIKYYADRSRLRFTMFTQTIYLAPSLTMHTEFNVFPC